MNKIKYIVFIFLIFIGGSIIAQTPVKTVIKTDSSFADSIPDPIGNTISDSLFNLYSSDTLKVKKKAVISKDAIDEKFKYGAKDTNWTSIVKKEVYLYGEAYIEYEGTKITADEIIFNFNTKIVKAKSISDKKERVAKFTDGDNEVKFKELTYNFKTKKAFVTRMATQEGEFFVQGKQSKIVTLDGDSTQAQEYRMFIKGSSISTCDLDHQHFAIRTSKLKVIPDKVAVAGPSNLEIAGIPTPFAIPFGFFPLVKGASSGLIIPQNYDFDRRLGLGLREVGYYFPINDYLDLTVTGDIYSRGTHGIRFFSNYKKRYAYTGNVRLGYGNTLLEDPSTGQTLSQKAFTINLVHNQDPKAHPYRTIGGSINISSNLYDQRTFNDPTSVLQNTYNSNFNFRYRWPDSPFNVAVGMSHRQNTQTRRMDISIPETNVTMNTINPFKRKVQSGDIRWYENITMNYNSRLSNLITATDTTLFTAQTLRDMRTAMRQEANMNTNVRVLKYFNLTPGVRYEEIWFLRTDQRIFDPTLRVRMDTLGLDGEGLPIIRNDTIFGTVIDTSLMGFRSFRRFNSSLNLNTQIFGTARFSKGFIRGIRHLMKPNISFNYTPDTRLRYLGLVDTDTRPEFNRPQEYNPFASGAIPATLGAKQMTLGFGIVNIIEAKYYSKKDSTEKNINLLDNLNINGNYNFAADSFQWSDISISGNTRLFKGMTIVNFSATFTPYLRENGRRINRTVWSEKGTPLEFVNFNCNFNTGVSFQQIKQLLETGSLDGSTGRQNPASGEEKKKSPFPTITSLFDNFRISHNYSFAIMRTPAGRDTFMVGINSIDISGTLQISKNWNINFSRISYDFQSKSLIYPSFGFSRDLHCWQMSFNWFPSRDVYGFFIGVKSNTLNFIKYDYGQPGFGGFFQ